MTVSSIDVTTPSDHEIAIRRFFDAPPQMVFEAYTKPELVEQWLLGPEGWSFVTCEIDLRVGGAYRYLWRKEGGEQMGVRGVYQEIDPPAGLVFTEVFDDAWYPGEARVSISLEDHEGGTLLAEQIRYESQEARDGVLRSGATEGVAAGFERLERLVDGQ